MILTIWRHGEAGAAASDRERELTETGREDVARGGELFRRSCTQREIPPVASILHSPWRRTTSTAQGLQAILQATWLQALPAIQPGASVGEVDLLLGRAAAGTDASHLLLVSHQPLVSRLAEHYLGQRDALPSLTPGAFVSLTLTVPAFDCGELLFWAAPPFHEVCT